MGWRVCPTSPARDVGKAAWRKSKRYGRGSLMLEVVTNHVLSASEGQRTPPSATQGGKNSVTGILTLRQIAMRVKSQHQVCHGLTR